MGRSRALEALGLDIDWKALGEDGFVIRTAGPHLVIAGGPRRGTINGVYTFLEDIVGVRWFTPTLTHIPHRPDLAVGPMNIRRVPVFEVRTMNVGVAADVDWAARQRLNMPWGVEIARRLEDGVRTQRGLYVNDPKMSGALRYVGTESHTLGHDQLAPVSLFETHPETFGLADGKRDPQAQPCLTNADLVPVVVENVRRWLRTDPGASVISVSLGDFAKFCACGPCRTTIAGYGRSGCLLHFVNRVAAALEKDHPDLLVSTLAYHWFARAPPTKPVEVHRNVVVRYAPIYASSQQAYDEGAYNLDQRVHEHMLEWIRIAPRVWVWDDLDTYDATISAKRKHSNFEPLKLEKMVELDHLFDIAEREVADAPAVLERVRLVRLGLQYAIISHAPDDAPMRAKAIRDFFPVARRAGVRMLYSRKAGKSVRLDEFERILMGAQ